MLGCAVHSYLFFAFINCSSPVRALPQLVMWRLRFRAIRASSTLPLTHTSDGGAPSPTPALYGEERERTPEPLPIAAGVLIQSYDAFRRSQTCVFCSLHPLLACSLVI